MTTDMNNKRKVMINGSQLWVINQDTWEMMLEFYILKGAVNIASAEKLSSALSSIKVSPSIVHARVSFGKGNALSCTSV